MELGNLSSRNLIVWVSLARRVRQPSLVDGKFRASTNRISKTPPNLDAGTDDLLMITLMSVTRMSFKPFGIAPALKPK